MTGTVQTSEFYQTRNTSAPGRHGKIFSAEVNRILPKTIITVQFIPHALSEVPKRATRQLDKTCKLRMNEVAAFP